MTSLLFVRVPKILPMQRELIATSKGLEYFRILAVNFFCYLVLLILNLSLNYPLKVFGIRAIFFCTNTIIIKNYLKYCRCNLKLQGCVQLKSGLPIPNQIRYALLRRINSLLFRTNFFSIASGVSVLDIAAYSSR